EDRQRATAGVQRETAAQRRALLLAVDLEGVGARRRPEGDAAAGPDRRAARAGAGTAGALLAPRLRAAARDQAACFGRRRAAPACRLLGAHALMYERAGEAGAERRLVELDLFRGRRRRPGRGARAG